MHLAALFPVWLTHVPIDWIAMFVFAFLLTFDALRSGSGRASVLAISLPVAAFFASLIPHAYFVGSMVTSLTSPIAQGALFIVIFVVSYILTYRIIYTFGDTSNGFIFSVLTGISATIATIVAWLQVPALTGLWHFSPLVQAIFGGSFALFWLLAAYIVLAFVQS